MLKILLHEIGGITLFVRRVLHTWRCTPGNGRAIVAQMAEVCLRSLPTVAFAGLFVGMILVLQFSQMLSRYDALIFLGGLNTSAVVREVGPLIISFLLAGKVGAFTAAELGTMRVTEQIEAIECLGTNPLQYLVVPRFVAIVLSSLLLLAIGLMVSVIGSVAVATTAGHLNFLEYVSSIPRFVGIGTIAAGMFRCLVYGTIVAAVSCYKGYTATGGARGVGRAVTQAAIYTNLYVVVANFLTAQFLETVGNVWSHVTGGYGG
jgi:phospholipid/cholesterol/gamma-HCH transport system permease protein